MKVIKRKINKKHSSISWKVWEKILNIIFMGPCFIILLLFASGSLLLSSSASFCLFQPKVDINGLYMPEFSILSEKFSTKRRFWWNYVFNTWILRWLRCQYNIDRKFRRIVDSIKTLNSFRDLHKISLNRKYLMTSNDVPLTKIMQICKHANLLFQENPETKMVGITRASFADT